MRLNDKVIRKLMEDKGIDIDQLARLYKGSKGEFWVNCNLKCGLKRAYRLAEIFNCSVDDILIYDDDVKMEELREKLRKNKNKK